MSSLQKSKTTVVGVIPGELASTYLELPENLTFSKWKDIGKRIGQAGRSIQFYIGDWLNFGEHKYGEKYTQAADITGYDPQTLVNYAWVARMIPREDRRENLAWAHHRTVSSLNDESQSALLDWAEKNEASVRDLKDEVTRFKKSLKVEQGIAVRPETAEEMDDRIALIDVPIEEIRDHVTEETVDLIVTRPEFSSDNITAVLDSISSSAKSVLKEGGSMIVVLNPRYLPDALFLLGQSMCYQWTICMIESRKTKKFVTRKAVSGWMAAVWFVKGKYEGDWQDDIIDSAGVWDLSEEDDKIEDAISELIIRFSNPGQTVLDPCAGSSSVAAASIRTGRYFIGACRGEKEMEEVDALARRSLKIRGKQTA